MSRWTILSAWGNKGGPEDLDGTAIVQFEDPSAILGAWGKRGVPGDPGGSGFIDVGDILAVLAAWGPCK